MKILIDMNLSPPWVEVLKDAGLDAIHWSTIGVHNAPDTDICQYANRHDLDFGAILAATNAQAPSVIQVRTQDVSPSALKTTLLTALNQFKDQLESGALISINQEKNRVRLLPMRDR